MKCPIRQHILDLVITQSNAVIYGASGMLRKRNDTINNKRSFCCLITHSSGFMVIYLMTLCQVHFYTDSSGKDHDYVQIMK